MKKKKILLLMILIMTLNMLFISVQYASSTVGENYRIQYDKNESRYIMYNGVSQRFWDYYYIDDDNNKMEAYCINLGQKGAENIEGGYNVKAIGNVEDAQIINIINNGYPHKDYLELGLKDRNEAKFATQFALWIYTNNLDLSKIVELNDSSLNVKNAILNIYNLRNTNVELDTKVEIIEKETKIVNIENKNYYKVKFELKKGKDVIKVKYLENSVKIRDGNFKEIANLDSINEFYIFYPVESVNKDTTLNLKFEAKLKNQGAYYGKPSDSEFQDVALVLPNYEIYNLNIPVKLKYKKLQLEITKKDNFNKTLEGVKFELYDEKTNILIGEYISDSQGKIFIDFRKELNIHEDIKLKIREKETLEGYELLNDDISIKLEYDNCKKISIENVKKEIPKEELKETPKESYKVELPKTGM